LKRMWEVNNGEWNMLSVVLSYMAGRGRRKQPGRAYFYGHLFRHCGRAGRLGRTVHTVPRWGR
jgi:hypothetical protein